MRIPSSGPADTVPPYSAEELSATARGVAVFSAIEKGVSATSVTTEEPLAGAILRTLLYFDLFDYPLRLEEIVRYLGIRLSRRVALGDALATLERTGLIAESNGYRFLTERSATIVTARLRREEQGRRMWRRARRIASLLRHIPFVRAIFISGSLSHGLAEKGSDIDYFIVTEPGRLWLVRTLLVFIRRTLLLNRRTYLCLNYFVTTDRLAIEERQIYAACETASVRPLYNEAIHADFVRSNEWIVDFYPNFTAATKRTGYAPIEKGRSIVQRLGESLVPRRLAARIDRHLMRMTERFWQRKYPSMQQDERQRVLRTTPNESRAHADDYSVNILATYAAALERYGMTPLPTDRPASVASVRSGPTGGPNA